MPAILTNAAEEVLVYLLKTDEAVSSFVGNRIAPDQLPIEWKGKPSIVYEQQSEKRQRVVSGEPTGLIHMGFAVYCIDRTRSASKAIARAVKAALAVESSTTIAEVRVRQVYVKDGERYESLPGADGQEPPERYVTLDVVVHYRT